jgi:prepilin-type N-terminal cleavage/methylation domain-containing protein
MKKFRAFTLIECLIALLILAVSSLLLVQGYTQLMKVTKRNNNVYVSIADQMRDVESKTNSNAKTIGSAVTSDTYSNTEGHDIVLQKATYNDSTNTYTVVTTAADKRSYKTNVTVVANYAYQQQVAGGATNVVKRNDDDKNVDRGTDVRYIYFYR